MKRDQKRGIAPEGSSASSIPELAAKRAVIDRSIAKRLFDAPDTEARASILKELHFAPPTKPRPPRRRVAEVEEECESAED
jgi:hypothetical protein